MTNYDVVKKLIGNIMPIGETNEDERRFSNLKDTIELVDLLLSDIDRAAQKSSNVEFSIRRSQDYANEFLDRIGIMK